MTILERIHKAVESSAAYEDADTIDKLIALAYQIGRESATKEVSDDYTALIVKMRERASNCRYHKMANDIIGDKNYLHHCAYAGDVTVCFGSDETNL